MPVIANLLSYHYTVFHYDRRGRGDSGDQSDYNVEREIEDLEALIRVAGGPACIFGASAGSILSLARRGVGIEHKEVSVVDKPPVNAGETNRDPMENAANHIRELALSGHRSEAVSYFLTEMIGVPRAGQADADDTRLEFL